MLQCLALTITSRSNIRDMPVSLSISRGLVAVMIIILAADQFTHTPNIPCGSNELRAAVS